MRGFDFLDSVVIQLQTYESNVLLHSIKMDYETLNIQNVAEIVLAQKDIERIFPMLFKKKTLTRHTLDPGPVAP